MDLTARLKEIIRPWCEERDIQPEQVHKRLITILDYGVHECECGCVVSTQNSGLHFTRCCQAAQMIVGAYLGLDETQLVHVQVLVALDKPMDEMDQFMAFHAVCKASELVGLPDDGEDEDGEP